MILPFWASALVNFAVRFLNDWMARQRAEQALRELGAKTQALDSTREAERQEDIARAVDEVAAAAVDDPRDLRKD